MKLNNIIIVYTTCEKYKVLCKKRTSSSKAKIPTETYLIKIEQLYYSWLFCTEKV